MNFAEDKQVGSTTPFAIMREDQIQYVDHCNKEVDIKLKKALEIILKE